ncbi:MAG TPA: hypothetical protein VNR68_07150 [Sphingomicrobium sp.]|nr:hypothetical protein [Sphingomicrobium sp.]
MATGDRIAREARTEARRADWLSLLSLSISALALMASGLSAWTATKALDFNRRASSDTQRSTLFWQFQNQYSAVASRFPPQMLDPAFRPADGSDEYARLEAYWFFCFAQWYATHRVNPENFGELWDGYYVPLIADGLETPSLRYVMESMIMSNKMAKGDFNNFLVEMGRIARESGQPLSPVAERRLANIRRGLGRN